MSIIAFSGGIWKPSSEIGRSQNHPWFFIYKPLYHPGKPRRVRPAAKSCQTMMINGYPSLFFLNSSTFISLNRLTDVEIYYTANEEKIHELLTI
jgi:hypothetical protein